MILKAIILGIIEGLTEFLPVSSTGHLILANRFWSFSGDFDMVFNVVIQVGAILAVMIYFKDKLFPRLSNKRQTRKVYSLWGKVVIGFLPAAVLGVLFEDKIDEYLAHDIPVAVALIVGAILLLFAEARLKRVRVASTDDMSYRDALMVGVSQCMALWPGMSRSASTIIGGLFMGLSREAAAEYSFFLALPTIIGAAVLKLGKALLKTGLVFTSAEWIALGVGTLVSFIVALLVIAMFMGYIKRKKLAPFAYYRIALGIVVLVVAFM